MRISSVAVSLFFFIQILTGRAEEPQGIFYNEDDTHPFMLAPAGEETQAHLEQLVDNLAGTHVKTLVICCCAKRTNFDSKAWEPYWEGFDPAAGVDQPCYGDVPLSERGPYHQWVSNMYALFKAGVDPDACMITRARKHDISPWISIRMNDVHDAHLKRSALHSRFWMEHPELYRFPDRMNDWNDRCLDYGKQAVRDHTMALIREVLERYDMDGLELDWTRFPYHFKAGEEIDQSKVLTEWMATVHEEVGKAGERWHHPIKLAVRIPARPEVACGIGLDAVTWAKQGLVDHLVVCPFWATTDFDIPVEEWLELIKGTDVKVTAGLEANVRPSPSAAAYPNTAETMRGAAAAALSRGSQGIYLFNPFDIPKSSKEGLLDELDSLPTLLTQPRTHVLTYTDINIPGKPLPCQLPCSLAASGTTELRVFLVPPADRMVAQLRLGYAKGTTEQGHPKVFLKGQECPEVKEKEIFQIPDGAIVQGQNVFTFKSTIDMALTIESLQVEILPATSH